MKIIIVGASGLIGQKVDKALASSHEIIRVGSTSGDFQCDYTNRESVKDMFESIGEFDALISVAGRDSDHGFHAQQIGALGGPVP